MNRGVCSDSSSNAARSPSSARTVGNRPWATSRSSTTAARTPASAAAKPVSSAGSSAATVRRASRMASATRPVAAGRRRAGRARAPGAPRPPRPRCGNAKHVTLSVENGVRPGVAHAAVRDLPLSRARPRARGRRAGPRSMHDREHISPPTRRRVTSRPSLGSRSVPRPSASIHSPSSIRCNSWSVGSSARPRAGRAAPLSRVRPPARVRAARGRRASAGSARARVPRRLPPARDPLPQPGVARDPSDRSRESHDRGHEPRPRHRGPPVATARTRTGHATRRRAGDRARQPHRGEHDKARYPDGGAERAPCGRVCSPALALRSRAAGSLDGISRSPESLGRTRPRPRDRARRRRHRKPGPVARPPNARRAAARPSRVAPLPQAKEARRRKTRPAVNAAPAPGTFARPSTRRSLQRQAIRGRPRPARQVATAAAITSAPATSSAPSLAAEFQASANSGSPWTIAVVARRGPETLPLSGHATATRWSPITVVPLRRSAARRRAASAPGGLRTASAPATPRLGPQGRVDRAVGRVPAAGSVVLRARTGAVAWIGTRDAPAYLATLANPSERRRPPAVQGSAVAAGQDDRSADWSASSTSAARRPCSVRARSDTLCEASKIGARGVELGGQRDQRGGLLSVTILGELRKADRNFSEIAFGAGLLGGGDARRHRPRRAARFRHLADAPLDVGLQANVGDRQPRGVRAARPGMHRVRQRYAESRP